MKRNRRWQVGGVVLAVLAVAGATIYYLIDYQSFASTEFFSDTGVEPNIESPQLYQFVERPGRVTLAIVAGEPQGIISTYHGRLERVVVEMPVPVGGESIEVGGKDIKVAFIVVVDGRIVWKVGRGGVMGHINAEEVSERRITASYDITVAGHTERLQPGFQDLDFTFRGQAKFTKRPRPVDQYPGDIWPKP